MADDIMRFSESGALAMCEDRWARVYRDLQQEPTVTRGLFLGTLIDVWAGQWWESNGAFLPNNWVDAYLVSRGVAPEDAIRHLSDFDADVIEDAEWLMDRYMQYYGEKPPDGMKLVATQQEIAWRHKGLLIGQRLDGVVDIEGTNGVWNRWLLEVKSYKTKNLAIVPVLPQLTWYAKAMEEFYGETPYGILYDGIYTYRWKTPRHVADSFDRVYVDKTPEQIDASMERLDSLIALREDLRSGKRLPIKNLSYVCSSCGFKSECWAEEGGDRPLLEVVVED